MNNLAEVLSSSFPDMNIINSSTYMIEIDQSNCNDTLKLLQKEFNFISLVDISLNKTENLPNDKPLYVVHNDKIPAYTTNLTTDILQSGGYSTNSFKKALNKAILNSKSESLVNDRQLISSGEYYSFFADSTSPNLFFTPDWNNISVTSDADPASYIFSVKFLRGMYKTTGEDLNKQVSFLDLLHEFSKNNSVVGPHSSLIALVNEIQLQTLENLSKNLDRFEDEATTTPQTRRGVPIGLSAPMGSGFGFFDTSILSGLDVSEKSSGGGGFGGGGGMMALSGGGVATNGGGGSSFASTGLSLFVVANVLLIGVGTLVFFVIKLKRLRKK